MNESKNTKIRYKVPNGAFMSWGTNFGWSAVCQASSSHVCMLYSQEKCHILLILSVQQLKSQKELQSKSHQTSKVTHDTHTHT